MVGKIVILIIFVINFTNSFSQPTPENLNVFFEYIVLNGDTNYFNPPKKIAYKSNKELRKQGYIDLISYKESAIIYKIKYHKKRKRIDWFHLQIHLRIEGEIYKGYWLYPKVYSKNKIKMDKIRTAKEKHTQPLELIYPFMKKRIDGISSLNSAIIKLNYKWEE